MALLERNTQHNFSSKAISNTSVPAVDSADDLHCAVDLLVILSDPASDPIMRKRAEKWQRTEFFKLPAALRNEAIVRADVRMYQQGVR